MKSYTQTAVINTIPHFPLATVRKRPVPPPHLRMSLAYNRPVGLIRDSDKMRIYWWPDGTIDMVDVGGGHLIFYPKPTLKDVVAQSIPGDIKNCFFKFESEGAVYARWYDMNYFWSAEFEVTTWEQGEEITPTFIDGAWKFLSDAEKEALGSCSYHTYPSDSEYDEGPDEYEPPYDFPSFSSCCGRYFCQCRNCVNLRPKD